jgi:hypothetical protein
MPGGPTQASRADCRQIARQPALATFRTGGTKPLRLMNCGAQALLSSQAIRAPLRRGSTPVAARSSGRRWGDSRRHAMARVDPAPTDARSTQRHRGLAARHGQPGQPTGSAGPIGISRDREDSLGAQACEEAAGATDGWHGRTSGSAARRSTLYVSISLRKMDRSAQGALECNRVTGEAG